MLRIRASAKTRACRPFPFGNGWIITSWWWIRHTARSRVVQVVRASSQYDASAIRSRTFTAIAAGAMPMLRSVVRYLPAQSQT